MSELRSEFPYVATNSRSRTMGPGLQTPCGESWSNGAYLGVDLMHCGCS